MKIGIDTYSFDRPGQNYGVGPGVYVWHLLPQLVRLGAEHEFHIFANKENAGMVPKLANVKLVVNPLPGSIRAGRILHEQVFIPRYVKTHGIDVVHFLGNNISYLIADRAVLTVYDLMWKYYLERGDKSLKLQYFRLLVPRSIASARAVIAISKYVADEVMTQYGRKQEDVHPILLASGKLLHPNASERRALAQKYNYKFLYTVTTSMPHKNLITLLKAYDRLRRTNAYSGKLVISGQLKGRYYLDTKNFIEKQGLGENIVVTGFIPEEEKAYCYAAADAVVYPSLYEGFGLPVLEGMASGTPVIASNAASIPEVGGDACLYFDPYSVEELCQRIVEVQQQGLADTLIARGRIQIEAFSWELTAMKTLAVYEKMGVRR